MLSLAVTILTALLVMAPATQAATSGEISEAIEDGLVWLAAQQGDDGAWEAHYLGHDYRVGATGLAVLKFETHAIFERGISPFDPGYAYHENVEKGLDYIFSQAYIQPPPLTSAYGDPDPDDDGGVYFYDDYSHQVYETGIAMMAIAASNAPDRVVNVSGSAVNGWTYREVLEDAVHYMAWAQNESGTARGGWRYRPNYTSSDNSCSGFAVLGLGYAEAPAPWGFGIAIPGFVKDELSIWIDYIQDDTDGGSGYDRPSRWRNILKTGNLLYEMAFVGDTAATPRVQAAIGFIQNHWNDLIDTGWKGDPAYYQAMYCTMKGLEALGIGTLDGIDWFDEFSDSIAAQQLADGGWPTSYLSINRSLSSTFALLTMEKAVPPPRLSLVPVADTNPTGSGHTFTATLVDAKGSPMAGETITFEVIDGPHAGLTGTGVTDEVGEATWSYTGTAAGTDIILANGAGVTSNEARKTWEGAPPAPPPPIPGISSWSLAALVTALVGLAAFLLQRRSWRRSRV